MRLLQVVTSVICLMVAVVSAHMHLAPSVESVAAAGGTWEGPLAESLKIDPTRRGKGNQVNCSGKRPESPFQMGSAFLQWLPCKQIKTQEKCKDKDKGKKEKEEEKKGKEKEKGGKSAFLTWLGLGGESEEDKKKKEKEEEEKEKEAEALEGGGDFLSWLGFSNDSVDTTLSKAQQHLDADREKDREKAEKRDWAWGLGTALKSKPESTSPSSSPSRAAIFPGWWRRGEEMAAPASHSTDNRDHRSTSKIIQYTGEGKSKSSGGDWKVAHQQLVNEEKETNEAAPFFAFPGSLFPSPLQMLGKLNASL